LVRAKRNELNMRHIGSDDGGSLVLAMGGGLGVPVGGHHVVVGGGAGHGTGEGNDADELETLRMMDPAHTTLFSSRELPT